MKTSFENGAIVKEGFFHERVKYDISNNVLLSQFDGLGNITRYSVVNKWDFIDTFYSLFQTESGILDFMTSKKVSMVGRIQTIELENEDITLKIEQFADSATNAIFTEYTVSAKKDTFFKNVMNFQLEFLSYIKNLFAARFSLRNLARFLFGTLKSTIKGRHKSYEKDGFLVIKNDPFGECYIDFALELPAKTLESSSFYVNQFGMQTELKKGQTKGLRMVLSAGTRKDFSDVDVLTAIKAFDRHKLEALSYVANLNYPSSCKDEFSKAYYKSLLNCSLSMYKELGQFKGFLAGLVYQSPARTYYRDSYWTVLPLLKDYQELVKNQIMTLARGINKDGRCPSAVMYNFRNWWGNHYDSPSFFAILLYDYVRHTGDKAILDAPWRDKTILDAAVTVITKLEECCDDSGLLNKEGEFNRRDWCDNVIRNGYVTYDEALYARALFALSELYKDKAKVVSDAYMKKHNKVKKLINEMLWDEEKGYFINYKNADFVEDNLSIDTVVMALFKLCDEERAKRMLESMERLLETRNNPMQKAGDFGVLSVYPFYKRAEAVLNKSTYPYFYHNGGDWPYLSAAYAYAKKMYGLDYTYPLTRWFTYNLEKGNNTPVEFFSPVHPEGSLLQGWSSLGAAAFIYDEGDLFSQSNH